MILHYGDLKSKAEEVAEIKNLRRLEAALRAAVGRYGNSEPIVRVGYTQSYALYVHENLEAHHKVGQAKYLEQPARELSGTLVGIVKTALHAGKNLAQALVLAGLRLQRESQLLVPVDTGALKNSAFTRLDTR